MSTLAEIEAAAAELSPEQKQELFLFLAVRLRRGGTIAVATRVQRRSNPGLDCG